MKLIYLDFNRLPTEKAYGIQIMKMSEALAREGIEVELLVPDRKNPIEADPFVYYQIKKVFAIRRFPTLVLVNLLPKIGTWVQNAIFLLGAKLYLLFKNYDILYLREKFSAAFFKDYVLEVHTLPLNPTFQDFRLWQNARKLVVLTSFIKSQLLSWGIKSEKILVAPDGVDLEQFTIQSSQFAVREELGLPEDKKIVMYTGHLYEWKGAATVLEAAKATSSQFLMDTIFVFVGGTEADIARFKKQAQGLKNVLILGHQLPAEIPRYLAAADVLVLPNSGKFEISRRHTSPLKLFEYMAAGRPIVASDLPSLREVLNERNALLVGPDQGEALAEGIRKVLEDQGLGVKLASQALEDVKKYTWKNRAKKILEFILQSDS